MDSRDTVIMSLLQHSTHDCNMQGHGGEARDAVHNDLAYTSHRPDKLIRCCFIFEMHLHVEDMWHKLS